MRRQGVSERLADLRTAMNFLKLKLYTGEKKSAEK
jgi:hypothetical protein